MPPLSPMFEDDDEPDTSFASQVAVGGSTCSASTGYLSSQGNVNVQASSSRNMQTSRSNGQAGYSRSHNGSSRDFAGSNNSSGSPSRDERRNTGDGAWFDGASEGSSRESSDDEDDRPLSTLHPEAAAAQREEIKRKASRRAAKARAKGRNPGGDSGWDGEGGVPAELLSSRLESVVLTRQVRVYNWQLALGRGHVMPSSSSMRHRTRTHPSGDALYSGGVTNPARGSTSTTSPLVVHRRSTVRREEKRTPTMPTLSTIPSPASAHFPAIPSPVLGSSGKVSERHRSARRPEGYEKPMGSRSTSDPSRQETSAASLSSSHHHSAVQPMSATVTRSNTASTSRASTTGTRSWAATNTASTTLKSEEAPHARSVTDPLPQRAQQAVKANAFVGGFHGTRIYLDLYPETTARDILAGASQRGELSEPGHGLDWVVVESFAELGYGTLHPCSRVMI
jgi:hypothetical protein